MLAAVATSLWMYLAAVDPPTGTRFMYGEEVLTVVGLVVEPRDGLIPRPVVVLRQDGTWREYGWAWKKEFVDGPTLQICMDKCDKVRLMTAAEVWRAKSPRMGR